MKRFLKKITGKGKKSPQPPQIELWIHDFDRDKRTIYWLNGLAGTGKTTIAQTTAERAFADGRLGASFFCSREYQDRRNLRFIFPTLAVQLSRRYPKFRSAFVKLVRSDPDIVHESLYNQMEKLIVQPLVESTISTVIVIDALDECDDEEPASAILSVLGRLVAKIPTVKFFITGRPESRIREGFRLPLLADATDVFVLHEVDAGQVNNDIQLFLRHSFLEISSRWGGLDGWPMREDIDHLCERSAGLFVYAVATIRFIDYKVCNPKRQLERLLRWPDYTKYEGKTRLNRKTTLDMLYTSILLDAFGGDDPENDPRVRSVLGAVVLAANPLSPSAIAALLGFELKQVLPLLSSLHSLLVLQEDTNLPVRPFHKSFPDFIIDPARCTNPRFRVYPPDHHMELLHCCLETMNRKLERNMCKLPDGVINSEVIDLKERAEEHIGQALEYACRLWHKHLVGTIPARITPVLHRFLEEKFLFWLEALSILGTVRDAVEALGVTEKCEWIENQAQPTLDLVRDCSRFASVFFEVISMSAPHIYHSALPLSPLTSIIRGLYKQHASPFARIVRGVPLSWEPVVATTHLISGQPDPVAVWSPCSKFIAAGAQESVEVFDRATLGRLATFKRPSNSSQCHLGFSPDSRSLMLLHTNWDADHTDGGTGLVDRGIHHKYWEVINWDLQTGGRLSEIQAEFRQDPVESFTYSRDGNMVAAAHRPEDKIGCDIYTYDLPSRTRLGPLIVSYWGSAAPIWTHDEYLRFAIVNQLQASITIQEVEFTLKHPPTQVQTFRIPLETLAGCDFLLSPDLSTLAFTKHETIQVWDLKTLKPLLLESGGKQRSGSYSFSSDSHFFALVDPPRKVQVWKVSPVGYVLHQQFPPILDNLEYLRFSPDSRSIVFPLDGTINLWHTRDEIPPPPTSPTQKHRPQHFILAFSPDEKSVAFTQLGEHVVTILDLKSGNLRLTIDTDMKVECLGVAGDTVIVVGTEKIVTWDLPGGDCALNAGTNDSVQTVVLPSRRAEDSNQSLSPDLSCIVFQWMPRESLPSLEIYDVPTGTCLASITPSPSLSLPRFTQDGREVWMFDGSKKEGWGIIKDSGSGTVELKPLEKSSCPSGTFPWQSHHGYEVTDDGWVLSPIRKRLLWLPHRWRQDQEVYGLWRGRFLGLAHRLSEGVILEFLE